MPLHRSNLIPKLAARITMGSTGHWPVPGGYQPPGMEKGVHTYYARLFQCGRPLPFRPGGSRTAQAGCLCYPWQFRENSAQTSGFHAFVIRHGRLNSPHDFLVAMAVGCFRAGLER